MRGLKKYIFVYIAALLFGISSAVGYYIEFDVNLKIVLALSMIDSVLFITIYFALLKLLSRVTSKSLELSDEKRLETLFNNNTFIKIFLILLVIWMSLAIVRYPGAQFGGVHNQIKQFVGMDTKARHLSSVIYDNHYITGHHPVLLTYIFGAFIKFGIMIGDVNLGMWLLSCFVCIINALGWAYIIASLKKYLNFNAWILVFVFFCFNPLVVSFNTYVLKDNLFTTLLGIYSILILKILTEGEKSDRYKMMALSVLLPFVKNQGIYIVLIVNIVLIFTMRKEIKVWIMNAVLPVLIFTILFQLVIMPLAKIAPGGKQEALSLPFQATARTMVEHQEEIDIKELEIISRVLPIDNWGVYTPSNSDPIKFQYNQSATKSDLQKYFVVWVKQGVKYPKSYLWAFLSQTYGYYFIDYETSGWYTRGFPFDVMPDGVIVSGPKWESADDTIIIFLSKLTNHERYKHFFSVSVAFWIIIMCSLIFKGPKTKLLWILPIIIQWLICLASPVNGNGRYGMIVYEMVPIVLAFTFASKKLEKRSEKANG